MLAVASSSDTRAQIQLRYQPSDAIGLNSEVVVLTGAIAKGDYLRLTAFIRNDVRRFASASLVLGSPGGNLAEAIRIGTLFRYTLQAVHVEDRIGECASACFFIFVNSPERTTKDFAIGIHRPFIQIESSTRMNIFEYQTAYAENGTNIRKYLDDAEVPKRIIEKIFSLASTEVYWLTKQDVYDIGRRANWWDQLLVDRCELDKELEINYLKYGDAYPKAADARRHLSAVNECANAIRLTYRLEMLAGLVNSVSRPK